MRIISQLAEKLLASEEGLCSMETVIRIIRCRQWGKLRRISVGI